MADEELVKHARTMSGMLIMGEPVAFGSDAGLIDALADAIERLTRERDEARLHDAQTNIDFVKMLERAETAEWMVEMLREALKFYAQLSTYQTRTVSTSGERARAEAAERKVEKLREALKDAAAHLVAAASLLQRGGKKAAPSDKMFNQMLSDYMAASERARAALKETENGNAI